MVIYYGYYNNVTRGKRKEVGTDDAIPCILEPEGNVKAFRKSWARLILKIYEVETVHQAFLRYIGNTVKVQIRREL